MTPSESLSSRLADVAREVRSSNDVSAAADYISQTAADMVGGHSSAAGITLVHARHRVETAAATSEVVRRGDELQYQMHEGPCLDAAWVEQQVVTGDLAHDGRWPRWGPRVADELGVRSMVCTQLFTNEDQLGALNIYSTEPDAFDDEAQEIARLLGAHAAVAVAAAQQVQTLQVAVDHRTTIGIALGIIMASHDLDQDAAFLVLRRLSSELNRKIYDLAQEVIRTHRLPQQ